MSGGNQFDEQGEKVYFDIGGTIFRTVRTTLSKKCAEGSIFAARQNDRMDPNNPIFFDRSPKYFNLILDFMRHDGAIRLPDSEGELKDIRADAKNYDMHKLVEACDKKLSIIEANKPVLPVINSENELIQKIARPEKPVVIIRYNSRTWEDVFHQIDAVTFVGNNEKEFDIYFMPLTNDEVVWRFSIHNRTTKIHSMLQDERRNAVFIDKLEKQMKTFMEKKRALVAK